MMMMGGGTKMEAEVVPFLYCWPAGRLVGSVDRNGGVGRA